MLYALSVYNKEVGTHTNPEPRTGIIDKTTATNVRINALGIPKTNKPRPNKSPWRIIPTNQILIFPLISPPFSYPAKSLKLT